MSDFRSINRAAFEDNGIAALLTADVEDRLERLCRIMQEKNAVMNVTAITDDDGISRKHFCDCAFLAELLPDSGKLADIGCGGGFPCLVLATMRPGIAVTAIDSTAKKVNYVAQTASELGLSNLSGVSMRAEDGGNDECYRERYDIVTARAVAALDILCELCLPYLKVGGRFYAMKGKGANEELDSAQKAIKTLGCKVVKLHERTLVLDGETQTRFIIEIEKIAKTPIAYPRPYAKIKKKPL